MKISVILHPNSKNPHLEKDLLGQLHLYVKQLPLEGKANQAAIDALSSHFHVPKSHIFLLRGAKSKNKTFNII